MNEIIAGFGGGAGFSSIGVAIEGSAVESGLTGSLNLDITGS